jgi:hypothetical protein
MDQELDRSAPLVFRDRLEPPILKEPSVEPEARPSIDLTHMEEGETDGGPKDRREIDEVAHGPLR